MLEQIPDKHVLLMLLMECDSQWYEIGLMLGLSHNYLDGLKLSSNPNPVKLSMVLQSWMNKMPSPVTWTTIINAMESPIVGYESIADKIHKHLQTGNCL